MAHNKFNMNVNEVQIKIKRRTGEEKRKEKPHAASWVDLKYVQFSASSTNQNAPETASRSPFSKQITVYAARYRADIHWSDSEQTWAQQGHLMLKD